MTGIIYKQESDSIIGACFELYNEKGCGFLESVYHECLAVSKPTLTLSYRGRTLVQVCNPDFICYQKIIVELKTVSKLIDEHRAQLLNYLHATGSELGRLVNFGHYPKLEYECIAKTLSSKMKLDSADVFL
ncbi:MAG TPA: GxxExxY protein [Chthoniobacterales bacterium]|nr:GxxExxY protein [Chthoniobacterales bacterium]